MVYFILKWYLFIIYKELFNLIIIIIIIIFIRINNYIYIYGTHKSFKPKLLISLKQTNVYDSIIRQSEQYHKE